MKNVNLYRICPCPLNPESLSRLPSTAVHSAAACTHPRSRCPESEAEMETLLRVPVPRVLIDPESSLHFRPFDDHIEVKVALLLLVDHPLVSDFDSILDFEENKDEFRPLSVDSDLKMLSCMEEEVHFYCRNCSSKLTKGFSSFTELPSVNWREAADNWFGNCCCSFGGVSEKLVAEYAKSYSYAPGVCLFSTASVLLSKNDLLECEFPDVQPRQTFEHDQNDRTEQSPYLQEYFCWGHSFIQNLMRRYLGFCLLFFGH